MWGKDGTRQKSAAELVNKGNGLACEILALGTLMYVQKNLDTICSPTGGSVAEGFQRKNFSLHVSCISLSIFKVFFFFCESLSLLSSITDEAGRRGSAVIRRIQLCKASGPYANPAV